MAQKINAENMLLTEQSTIKVPYEALRRNLRTSQKHVERDITGCQTTLAELKKKEKLEGNEAIQAIDNMLHRMRGLKRKLSDVANQNQNTIVSTRARLNHLSELHNLNTFTDAGYNPWIQVRTIRHLVDYLLRHEPPLFETVMDLARSEGYEDLVSADIELFKECTRVEQSLREGRATEALAWCKENNSTLKKMKSTLEFDLRYQEFIELVRNGKHEEGIAYVRKHLVIWGETHLAEIRQAMALLAFNSDTSCLPYQRLYDRARWNTLATSFRSTLFSLHSLPPLPVLNLTLHAGLASLKLPTCFADNDSASAQHNPDCPICDQEGLGLLAKTREVPFAHHVNSIVVCKITGKIMEGDGLEPMALPNGRVYSREALEAMADKAEGIVVCPRTGDKFNISEARKVFIS